ncbi:MAG TPA: SGNH/GDSL hydrolase family protein [Clostridiaceae bacterium]
MRKKIDLYNVLIVLLSIMLIVILVAGKMKDNKEALKVAELVRTQEMLSLAQVTTQTEVPNSNSTSISSVPKNVYEKLNSKESISILIIGDFIAESDGVEDKNKWNVKLSNNIESLYEVKPTIKLLTLPKGNALTSWSKYMDLEALNKYDLVFLCYGENDITDLTIDQFQGLYENIIRRINTNNPLADIVPIIESSIQLNKTVPAAIINISKNYGLSFLDMGAAYKASNVPYNTLSIDGILPNSAGCDIYANIIMKLIKANVASKKVISSTLKDPLYASSKEFDSYKLITTFEENTGFTKNNELWTSDLKASALTTKFTGSLIGATVQFGPDCGKLSVLIDNKLIKEFDCYSPVVMEKQILIAQNLAGDQHTIKLSPARIKAPKSTGFKIDIVSLFTN